MSGWWLRAPLGKSFQGKAPWTLPTGSFCECHEVRIKGFCKVRANGIVMTKPQMLFSLICIKMGPVTPAFHHLKKTTPDACLRGGPACSWERVQPGHRRALRWA